MIGSDEQAERPAVRALQEEVDQLRQTVVSHAVVDRAIGVVITDGGLTAEQGWAALKHISQHTDIKLREVADTQVRWPASGTLPEALHRALSAAVARARGSATDGRDGPDGHPQPSAGHPR
ncbi:ANTAR domain-containing protein [Streptomyces sp. NPDC090073]|uniref:ANTAR domain-containing protein n=1 Tax=Streptomyces sp. NPDC090073 TaxID=3365936 RepID=UPI00381D5B86